LRHCEQWQFNGAVNGPVIANSTPPHRQLPWMGDMGCSFDCDPSSDAVRICDYGDRVQWPNERKSIFFHEALKR
jgi:hypothetical protein